MRTILHEARLDALFKEQGYAKIPFLDPQEALDLRDLIDSLNQEGRRLAAGVAAPYALSFFSSDRAYRHKVFEQMCAFLMPRVARFVQGYRPLIANIFDKDPGTGEVPMHQNWTFVDESQHSSITIYIPLCDVRRHNGTLEVVPGSHVGVCPYRGPSIPWVFRDIVTELKRDHCVPVDLDFGEAGLIFDSIVHYSSQNDSDNNRLACQIIMVPEEAPSILYHWEPSAPRQLEIYGVDPEFFWSYQQPEKPTGVDLLGTLPFELESLDVAAFAARLVDCGGVHENGPLSPTDS